jgi:hypothetical protein
MLNLLTEPGFKATRKTMSISQRLLRLLSYFTFRPIHKGFGTTVDSTDVVSVRKDPDVIDLSKPIFFRPRTDLGPFEIRQITTKDDGTVTYILYNSLNERTFKIRKKWFDFLFERITDDELEYNPYEHPPK